ncbi:MAG: hypothetical protein ACJ740_15440, partial [Gaiellales bacterium]
MTEDGNSWAAPYEDAMQAAAAKVAPARRRLTDHQAEQIVTEEFSAGNRHLSVHSEQHCSQFAASVLALPPPIPRPTRRLDVGMAKGRRTRGS